MKREAMAVWRGDLRNGKGTLETQSKALAGLAYSFRSRFGQGTESEPMHSTNPEELIAAAHAGCFSMALAGELGKAQLSSEKIETHATLTLEQIDGQWTTTGIHLQVKAKVPGAHYASFLAAAERAKAGCPVSRLLNTKILLDAELDSAAPAEKVELVIYTSSYCQVCGQVKDLLEKKQIPYQEIDLDLGPEEAVSELKKKTGLMKVPQVFVNGQFIGGYEDLVRLDSAHQLERLFAKNGSERQSA